MKYGILLLVAFCASCWTAMGEVSKKQLKDAESLVKMGGVRDSTDKKRSGEYEILKIDFSSKQAGLGNIYVRIAVEVTDKEKKTYLVEEMERYTDDLGDEYKGNGYWILEIPHGSFDKLKISAYAVEFGVMDGKEFVSFDARYNHVKTYEGLTARTTTPFSGKCDLRFTYEVKR